MFALVADDTLYLKSDSQSEALYRAHGLEQFAYQKGEKTVLMSYFMAPDEVLDDPQALHDWAAVAFEAALRARR